MWSPYDWEYNGFGQNCTPSTVIHVVPRFASDDQIYVMKTHVLLASQTYNLVGKQLFSELEYPHKMEIL